MVAKYTPREKKAFTLIELLIVISIIAVLAAILFPVFARARENARRASCMSNMKQMGLAMTMYAQDYDETMMGARLVQDDDEDIFLYPNGRYDRRQEWYNALWPYAKSNQLFYCPSQDKVFDSRARSFSTDLAYSYNYAAPAGSVPTADRGESLGGGGIGKAGAKLAAIESPSTTIAITEGSTTLIHIRPGMDPKYDATEESVNERGVCDTSKHSSYYAGCARARHLGTLNVVFVDGHVKAMNWKMILSDLGNKEHYKYWTTKEIN